MLLTINGTEHDLQGADPAQSLATFCREQAGGQGVRVACGSGACGACTVAAIPPGGHDVRTINACLAPVGSLAGYRIVTAAGLGSSSHGFHPVQERMGAFHASQCGFCTPGIVAALGGALSRAQLSGRQMEGAELASCIDGNLCRCTGYRPIVDVCKSLSPGADIEDLGLHSPLASLVPESSGCALLLEVPPGPTNSDGTDACKRLEAGGRTWLAPSSLAELLDACTSACSTAGGNGDSSPSTPPRFLAGNTGAGLFHELWPTEDPLVISLGRVQELQAVTTAEGHLVVGAGVTIAEMIAALTAHSGSSIATGDTCGGKQAQPAPFAALAAMLARIAGIHVRQAGSVGGNLVLAKQKGLESDLATALMGWGASVVLLDVSPSSDGTCTSTAGCASDHTGSNGGNRRSGSSGGRGGSGMHTTELPLAFFLSGGHAMVPAQLLVALRLPLPQEGDYLWCHKVAPTHSNVHATMNTAVKLRLAGRSGAGSNGGASSDAGTDASPTTISSATVVFGYYSSTGWACHRAAAAEAALTGAELSVGTLRCALHAVLSDVAPARRPQECAAMAQGLLLQVLAPLARQHCAGGRLERLLQVPPANVEPALMRGRQAWEPADASLAPLGAPLEKDRVLLQTSGEAQYVGDIPLPAGSLHAAWVTSTQARAPLLGIDPSEALAQPGVSIFLSAADLAEGHNQLMGGPLPMFPEPVFASGQVDYHSQPVGLVLASSPAAARRAAQRVHVSYGPPAQPPVLSIEQAVERSAYYSLVGPLGGGEKQDGDAGEAIRAAECRVIGGRVRVPANYHLYLEPQSAVAFPDEGGAIKVFSSAQNVDGVQQAVAHALGMRQHSVQAVCRRAGGGFGGKATRNLPVAVAAALAASKAGRAVSFVQDRLVDMRLNGGRCETLAEYDVGFTSEGLIQGLSLRVFFLLGAYPDLPIDNICLTGMIGMAYNIPHFSLTTKLCHANLPPTTFMRAPGDAQAAFIMESILEHVAAQCGLDAAAVRERNFLPAPSPAGNGASGGSQMVRLAFGKQVPAPEFTLPRMWDELKRDCRYQQRAAEVAEFNKGSAWVKRGLGMTHTRFDCFVYSKPACVSIFADGSIVAYGAGGELGQGLTTKVKQVVLSELSQLLPAASRPLPADLVRMGDQSSHRLPAGYLTGGSTTSESACQGMKHACQLLVQRLQPFADKLGPRDGWDDLMAAVGAVNRMDACKVPLTAYGHNSELGEKGAGTGYTIWGVACSEAEINMLTGERRILRTDAVMDCGRSLNPAIDIGQVEGAFAMGLGMCLSEARRVDPSTGRLLTDSLWDYHAPTQAAMPRQLNVSLLPGSRLEQSALSAKAVGEPPLMLATSALSALQAAVRAARAELADLGGSADYGKSGGVGDEAECSSMLLQLPVSAESVMAAVWGGSGQGLAALL